MWRGYVAFAALALIGLALTGCGGFHYEQREPWRAQAEQACMAQNLVRPSAYMSRLSAIQGPGSCGIDYPFRVAAFGDGTVGVSNGVTLACPIIPRIDEWLNEVVQPAASTYFGSSVVEVRAGSYSCRPRNGQRGARVSEHAYGNAIDVMAFRFADGREVAVAKGWRGAEEEQEFLREVFVASCNYFTTVLGPGSDAFHYDHFHLDLARHDARGERHVCKPVIKFTPRLGDETAQTPASPRSNWQPADQAPIDMESDDDPFAVGPTSARPPSSSYSSAKPAAPAKSYGAAEPFAATGSADDVSAYDLPGPSRSSPQPAAGSSPGYARRAAPAANTPSYASGQALYSRPSAGPALPVPALRSAAAPASVVGPAPVGRQPMVLQPQLWDGQGIY